MTIATDLLGIARKAKGLNAATDRLLGTCKAENITNVDQFDQVIRLGYVENSWSQKTGRPPKGSKLKPAPDAVQNYVSMFRRFLTLGLHFKDFTTVYQMREAIKERATAPAAGPEPRPALKGVVIRQPHVLTGALWHDGPALAEELPDDLQEEYENAIREVMERYLKFAPSTLVQDQAA